MGTQFEYIHFPPEEFHNSARLVATRGLLYPQAQADRKLSDRITGSDEVARRTTDHANDHAAYV